MGSAIRSYILSGVIGILIGALAQAIYHYLVYPQTSYLALLLSLPRPLLIAKIPLIYFPLMPLLFLTIFSWIIYKKHFKIWEKVNELGCVYFSLIGYSIGWYSQLFWREIIVLEFSRIIGIIGFMGAAFVFAPLFVHWIFGSLAGGVFFILSVGIIGYFITKDIKNLFKRILAILFLILLTLWPFAQVVLQLTG